MLTGVAKIGYLLAYTGLALLAHPVIKIFTGGFDILFAIRFVVGAAVVVVGLAMMRQDPTVRSLGWRLHRLEPRLKGNDKVALVLVLLGAFMLAMFLSTIQSGRGIVGAVLYLAVALPALLAGWGLALHEFRQPSSPE
jgi:hypothetical protein